MQEKPFRCPLCDRCFGQQTNLDRHLKKHESDGPQILDDVMPSSRGHHHHQHSHRDLDLELARVRMRSPSSTSRFDVDRETSRYFNEIRRLVDQACGGSAGRLDSSAGYLYGDDGVNRSLTTGAGFDSVMGGSGNGMSHSSMDDRRPAWLMRSPGLVPADSGVADGNDARSSSSASRSPVSAFNSVDDNEDGDSEIATAAKSRNHRGAEHNWTPVSSQPSSEVRDSATTVTAGKRSTMSALDSPCHQKTSPLMFNTGKYTGSSSVNNVVASSSSSSKRQRLHDLLAFATGSSSGLGDRCSSPETAGRTPGTVAAGPVQPAAGSLHQQPCVY